MNRLFLILSLVLALWGSAFAAVNVNTATKEELDGLKGIGPVKAQAIVDYRAKNGPFKSVDDLKNVTGIGPKTLEDIRQNVTVSGPGAVARPKPAPSATQAVPAKPVAPSTSAKATEAPKVALPAPATQVEPAKTAPAAMKAAQPGKSSAPAGLSKPAESAQAAGAAKTTELTNVGAKKEAPNGDAKKAKADKKAAVKAAGQGAQPDKTNDVKSGKKQPDKK